MYLQVAPRPWALTFDNDFSAAACFARAVRQLRAATLLAHFGYYSEVGTVLRAAYEAAALGRFLAHEPEQAAKWLRKGTWFPDRAVRKWFSTAPEDYAAVYGALSADAHPTARSCLSLVEPSGDTYELKLDTAFDAQTFEGCLEKVLSTTLWTCFAFRNAAVREEVLHPEWRRALAELAREAMPHADWSHLDRRWEEEKKQWESVAERVRHVDELDREMATNPYSVENLWGATGSGEASED